MNMCAEWGAISLGSLDVTPQAIACSPSNVTRDAGFASLTSSLWSHVNCTLLRCLIAILNSNMELTLWAASKNFLHGQWTIVRSRALLITRLFSPILSDQ